MAYKARLTVKSVAGHCGAGYKVGGRFATDGTTIAGEEGQDICLYAFPSLVPYLASFCRETAPSDWINGLSELQCPDSRNTVVFAVERTAE